MGCAFRFRGGAEELERLMLGDELPLEPDPLGLPFSGGSGEGEPPLRLSSFAISSTLGDLRFLFERSGVDTSWLS